MCPNVEVCCGGGSRGRENYVDKKISVRYVTRQMSTSPSSD